MKKFLRIGLIILILVWMWMVFSFSAADGTSSSGISQKIASLFTNNEEMLEIIEQIIRKIAHLSEYFLGGFLFYGLFLTFNIKPSIQVTASILCGILYSITDEVHQLFIPGRNGCVQDVCIDSIGVVLGVCILLFIVKIINIRREKNVRF